MARRLLLFKKAEFDFLSFCLAMNPHPDFPDDPTKSRFQIKSHHRLVAQELEAIQKGDNLRLALSMPPQHGKSEEISRLFPAWYMGKQPWKNYMFGTYSQDFANDFGAQVRAIMNHPNYALIFPKVGLRKDSKAKDYQVTTENGQLAFVGRGGAGTGKPADLFIIDDPLKDDQEASSPATRESVYQWFTKVAYTRCHSTSAIVIVHTRWNEDDLIGRICDPDHPNHDKEIAGDWRYVNIPAVIDNPKLAEALGIKMELPEDDFVSRMFCGQDEDGKALPPFPIAPLWGERFSLRHLASAKKLNPRGFTSLYQGRPTPEDGDYFKRDWIRYYNREDLPPKEELTFYAASDHSASVKTQADPSCLGAVGIDCHGNIYVLPDLIWEKMETNRTVEEMIAMMKRRKPAIWFAESDLIKKSFGPFLRKRMKEEHVYTPVFDMSTKQGDKVMRARSIQGRMEMGMVYLPAFASWTEKAVQELLKFPNGTHDDFVDMIAWIGLGLDSEHAGSMAKDAKPKGPPRGTFGAMLADTKRRAKRKVVQFSGGW